MARPAVLLSLGLLLASASVQAAGLLPISFRDAYEALDRSSLSSYTTRSIWPFSCDKVLALDEGELPSQYRGLCTKKAPFSVYALELSSYYLSEEDAYSLVLDEEAKRLREGVNAFLTISMGGEGRPGLGYFVQLRGQASDGEGKGGLYRGYAYAKLGKFLFVAGRDNVKLGPCRFGGLLSGLSPPFWQVRVQTAEPIRFLGLWDFLVLRGWLVEQRKDHSNPDLLALRASFKPASWLEFGVNRATLYGGKGRPGYSLFEYPRLVFGQEENVPGSRYDNDAYLGFDIALDIPLGPFDLLRLYYEKEATDVKSALQKGEKFQFDLPFIVVKLYEGVRTLGVLARKGSVSFRGEVTMTEKEMYLHHHYPYEGFSYKGVVLGHPYGRDVLHISAQLKYEKENRALAVEAGFMEQPHEQDLRPVKEVSRYYVSLAYKRRWRGFELSSMLRFDLYDGKNLAETPLHYKLKEGEGVILTAGLKLVHFF